MRNLTWHNLSRALFAAFLAALGITEAHAATNFVSPVQTYACASHTWANSLAASTAATTCTQPSVGDLNTVAAGTVLGNPTGSTAAPSATATPVLGLGGTTTGTLGLSSSGGNAVTLSGGTASITAYTITPPPAAPVSNGQAWTATTAGVGSWTTIVTAAFTVSSKTSAYPVVSGTDDWKRFDNTSAGGSVTFTLPASPSAGDNFCFLVTAAQALVVLANTGQTITMGNVTGASAGNLTASTVGSSVCVYYESTTTIYAWASQGAWALT